MTQRMLIDATHAEETRVAVVDGSRLVEFEHETSTKKQLKGNVYLAKVVRVEPSLQAAFVEYGGNRHGFLAFNEVHPDYYRIPISDREALLAQSTGEEEGDEEEGAKTGETVDTLGGDESDDIERAGAAERKRLNSLTRRYKIQEVIKRRQILLVQVVKEERGTKGAALTTYLSLAGRYCVLMPNTGKGGGISRKISSIEQRRRLKVILGDLAAPPGMAVILRTAGVERSKAEIKRDYEYLRRLWDEIRERTLVSSAPCLIHEEANIIKRALRDVYSKDIEEVIIDGDEAYKTAKAFMKTMLPSHAKRVQRFGDEAVPLFHRYQVESQLDEIERPTVKLRSGGYIVINQTEALVAIDVNSGRATRERNIEETALATNREAAQEVARQLRLRDLAGLIVIDFIDMEHARNNATIERTLKEAMRSDRARLQVGRISPFGLLELSRQRLRPSLTEGHSQPCPACGGTGHLRSTESSALRALRALEEEGVKQRGGEVILALPPAVALYILNHKRLALAAIELRYAFRVSFATDEALVPPDFRVQRRAILEPVLDVRPIASESGRSAESEAFQPPQPVAGRPPVEEPEDEEPEAEEEPSVAEPAGAPSIGLRPREPGEQPRDEPGQGEQGRGRRRRRRRGGRRPEIGLTPQSAPSPATAASGASGLPEPFGSSAGSEDTNVGAEEAALSSPEAVGGTIAASPHGGARPQTQPLRPGDETGEGRRRRRGRRGGRRRRGGRDRDGSANAGTQPAESTALAGGSGPFPVEPESAPTDGGEPGIESKLDVDLGLAAPAAVPTYVAAVAAMAEEPEAAANQPAGEASLPDAIASEVGGASLAPKPRRRRAPRPKRTAGALPEPALPSATEFNAPAAPAPAALAIATQVEPTPAPPATAPSPLPAAETVAASGASTRDEAPSQPRKRGWWSRMIGEAEG